MKHLKNIIGILLSFFMLSACSSDDDNSSSNIIVGKWQPIEKYQSNQQIDLDLCEPFFYVEYNADHSVFSNRIETNQFPDECGIIISEFGVVWVSLGNNQYRIDRPDHEGPILTIYKEGVNLAIENSEIKTVYQPYL